MSYEVETGVSVDNEELKCMAENIYFEGRAEPMVGKIAIGHVVMNRIEDKRFPDTVCGVVKQTKFYPSGRIDLHSCQFSWYCDGKSDKPRDKKCWDDALLIAEVMITYSAIDVTDGALWYHSRKVQPEWSMVYVKTVSIDNHIFYKDID